ncbi:MAG TPA: hypothetical protein VMF12_13745 [Xanthobacteraceae bacterium]|nr:hypothetical protein [Xanthobacteraceae bacterium]
MFRVIVLAAALVVLSAGDCLAQSSTSAVTTDYKVAAVSAWVLHGAPGAGPVTIGGDVAHLMGLSNSDLSGFAATYGSDERGLFLYFVTLPRRPEVILVRKDIKLDRKIYWLVRNSALSTTVARLHEKVSVVYGAVFDKAGMAILDNFYDHLPQNNSSASPHDKQSDPSQ